MFSGILIGAPFCAAVGMAGAKCPVVTVVVSEGRNPIMRVHEAVRAMYDYDTSGEVQSKQSPSRLCWYLQAHAYRAYR